MSTKSSGETNVQCDRYHGNLPVRTCVLRHRLAHVTGCRKCRQGEERETEFGYLFPTDLATLASQATAYVAAVFSRVEPDPAVPATAELEEDPTDEPTDTT